MAANEVDPVDVVDAVLAVARRDFIVVRRTVLGDVEGRQRVVLVAEPHQQGAEPGGVHLPAHAGEGEPAQREGEELRAHERRLGGQAPRDGAPPVPLTAKDQDVGC